MLECHFSKPAKEKIAQMQAVGMSDDQIVQAFIREYGAGIYLATPNAFGWIIPYFLAGVGMVIVVMYLKSKYKKPKPMTDLGAEACTRRLRGLTKLTRDEIRLAGYPDSKPEIDVCAASSEVRHWSGVRSRL